LRLISVCEILETPCTLRPQTRAWFVYVNPAMFLVHGHMCLCQRDTMARPPIYGQRIPIQSWRCRMKHKVISGNYISRHLLESMHNLSARINLTNSTQRDWREAGFDFRSPESWPRVAMTDRNGWRHSCCRTASMDVTGRTLSTNMATKRPVNY